MEMYTWEYLATVGGAAACVAMVTQFLKLIPVIEKLPTQFVSYIVSVIISVPALLFTGALTVESATLVPFNALVIMLAANGAYNTLSTNKAKYSVENQ